MRAGENTSESHSQKGEELKPQDQLNWDRRKVMEVGSQDQNLEETAIF